MLKKLKWEGENFIFHLHMQRKARTKSAIFTLFYAFAESDSIAQYSGKRKAVKFIHLLHKYSSFGADFFSIRWRKRKVLHSWIARLLFTKTIMCFDVAYVRNSPDCINNNVVDSACKHKSNNLYKVLQK